MEPWERFAQLFSGYEKAFGQYQIKRVNDRGKQEGKAWTQSGVPGQKEWTAHLEGQGCGMGQIPLKQDDTLVFGAIDIDNYNVDVSKIETDIKRMELPLVPCLSKSGGVHLYVFFKKPVPASEAREKLESWAASLGFGGVEVFPKQSYRIDENDIGNWINLPYYNAAETQRPAIKDGERISLNEFLDTAEKLALDDNNIEEAQAPAEQVGDDGGYLSGAPPCLCHYAKEGIPEGQRNEGMFNMAGYLKKRYPDDWHNRLMEYNQRYCDPPLALEEINTIVKSIEKKGYDLKCNGPYCDRKKCRRVDYGVGETATGEGRPEVQGVTKYDGDPVYWVLEIDGQRVECDTETLYSQAKFNQLCMEKINRCPGSMQKGRWERFLDSLISSADVVKTPEDASKSGQFVELLEYFCTGSNRMARHRDEIREGKPWTDEDGKIYFRSQALFDYLKERKFFYKNEHQVWRWLQQFKNADKTRIKIKGKTWRVWVIDGFETSDEDEEPHQFYEKEEF